MERNVYFKISTYISADISLLIHVHSTSTFYSPAQSALVQVCIYTLHNIKSNMQWPLSAQSDVWCHHNAQPDVSVSPLSNVLKSHFSYYDHSHPASCTHWAGPGSSTWRDGSDQFLFRDKLVKLATRGHRQSWSWSGGYRASRYTGCCKTTGKLWQHITESLYGVFLLFCALLTVKYGRFFTLVQFGFKNEHIFWKYNPGKMLDFRVG